MEYVKGDAYYALSQDVNKQYPYLNKDISCQMLIIGGGIDGAIANYYLSQSYDTVLVDKGRFGCSCTSCATPLCEYQLDLFAHQLPRDMSEQDIVDVYKMGLDSIDKLSKLISRMGNHCHFELSPTVVYTENAGRVKHIEQEYDFRQRHGFACELYTKEHNPLPFDIESALYCPDGGCTFNPYRLVGQLIDNSTNQCGLYENTQIEGIEHTGEYYVATTNYGNTITAKYVVVATGFDWELLGKQQLCQRYVTYTLVTEPIADLQWYEGVLVEDDADPYHYFKVTHDNRIVFGGEDTPWKDTINADKANKLYDKLEAKLRQILPQYSHKIRVQYRFCGSFGSTANNLGIIGESDRQGLYYFFSCGANGIINAMYGVQLLQDQLQGKDNPMQHLFTVHRAVQ